MEPWIASTVFPLAIRARLSTEESASDASSSFEDSEGSSGIGVAAEEESYVTEEGDAAFLRRPFMPKARITGDDEDDDILQEAVFEDNDGDEEENHNLSVEGSEAESSIGGDYENLVGGFASGRVEGGLSFGSDAKYDRLRDEGFIIASLEEFQLLETESSYFEKVEVMPALANDGDLELKEMKLEMDGIDIVKAEVENDMDSISAVYDKIGGVSSWNVDQSNDLSWELKDLMVVDSSNTGTEKNTIASDIEEFSDEFVSVREENGLTFGTNENDYNIVDEGHVIAPLNELQLQVKETGYFEMVETVHAFDDALASDGSLALNEVKLEMDGRDAVVVEVKDDLNYIFSVYDKIGAVSSGDVEQSSDFALELKHLVIEAQASDLEIIEDEDNPQENIMIGTIGTVTPCQSWDEEMQPRAEEAGSNVWEVMKEEDSKVEAGATEFKRIAATNTVDFIRSQIHEPASIPVSREFGPKTAVVCTNNVENGKDKYSYVEACSMDSKKAKDFAGNLLNSTDYENAHESYYHIKEFFTENTKNCVACECSSSKPSYFYASENETESRLDSLHVAHDEGSGKEDELVISECPERGAILENSEIVKNMLEEMVESSSISHSCFKSSQNNSHILDGQNISDSVEEVQTEENGSAKELFDTSVLAAVLRAVSGVSNLINSQDSSSIFSIKHPSGFRSATSFLSLTHSPILLACIIASSHRKTAGEYGNCMNDDKMLHLKVEQIRLKYLNLLQRLSQFADDALPDHDLYRLGLVGGANGGKISEEFCFEEKCKDDFAYSCKILVIGKTGVGKSAVINSIFGEERASVDPLKPATTSVREISGMVDGVFISVIDTPGLLTSLSDQGVNRKILSSIKKYARRIDVVLYVDRLDTNTRDLDDLHILRMITLILGSSIWHNAIIALTHAGSASPDGPYGSPLSYEMIVAQRSQVIQHSIWQAAGDVGLMNPVALIENHHSCRKNMDGESLLPNSLRWRAWLLLLCYSTKITSEVKSILKRSRNKGDGNYDFFDIDSDNMANGGLEVDDGFNQLLSFKPLRRSQLQGLSNEQKNAYFDKYAYRFNVLQRKQWKDEQVFEQQVNSAVHIPLPDMASPFSLYSDNPKDCYKFQEQKIELLTRPVMYAHYWGDDSVYDDVIMEENIDISCLIPISLSVRITIDKKELSIYLGSISAKHGKSGSILVSVQLERKQMVQFETKFRNLKNKAAAGILFNFIGETFVNGFELEDLVLQGKKLGLIACNDVVGAESDVTNRANSELLMKKCYSRKKLPMFDLSVIWWRDFFVRANLQFEFSTPQSSRMSVRIQINNPKSGRISIKTCTTKQVHVAILGLFSIMLSIYRSIWTKKTN